MPSPQLSIHEAAILAVALDNKDRLTTRYLLRDLAKALLAPDERASDAIILCEVQNLLDATFLITINGEEDIIVTKRGKDALEQFLLTTAAIHDQVSKTHVITA